MLKDRLSCLDRYIHIMNINEYINQINVLDLGVFRARLLSRLFFLETPPFQSLIEFFFFNVSIFLIYF